MPQSGSSLASDFEAVVLLSIRLQELLLPQTDRLSVTKGLHNALATTSNNLNKLWPPNHWTPVWHSDVKVPGLTVAAEAASPGTSLLVLHAVVANNSWGVSRTAPTCWRGWMWCALAFVGLVPAPTALYCMCALDSRVLEQRCAWLTVPHTLRFQYVCC